MNTFLNRITTNIFNLELANIFSADDFGNGQSTISIDESEEISDESGEENSELKNIDSLKREDDTLIKEPLNESHGVINLDNEEVSLINQYFLKFFQSFLQTKNTSFTLCTLPILQVGTILCASVAEDVQKKMLLEFTTKELNAWKIRLLQIRKSLEDFGKGSFTIKNINTLDCLSSFKMKENITQIIKNLSFTLLNSSVKISQPPSLFLNIISEMQLILSLNKEINKRKQPFHNSNGTSVEIETLLVSSSQINESEIENLKALEIPLQNSLSLIFITNDFLHIKETIEQATAKIAEQTTAKIKVDLCKNILIKYEPDDNKKPNPEALNKLFTDLNILIRNLKPIKDKLTIEFPNLNLQTNFNMTEIVGCSLIDIFRTNASWVNLCEDTNEREVAMNVSAKMTQQFKMGLENLIETPALLEPDRCFNKPFTLLVYDKQTQLIVSAMNVDDLEEIKVDTNAN